MIISRTTTIKEMAPKYRTLKANMQSNETAVDSVKKAGLEIRRAYNQGVNSRDR